MSGIRINKLANVIPLNIAAWDKECMLRLYVGQGNVRGRYFEGRGWSSVKRRISKKYVSVCAKPLDRVLEELKIDYVDWIKIDVEGSEHEVLKGLSKTIKRSRPRLIVESNDYLKLQTFGEKFCHAVDRIASSYFVGYPLDRINDPELIKKR